MKRTRQDRFIDALFRPINTSAVILLGVYTVLWGLWMANPAWQTFSVSGTYSQMERVAPEWAWGLVALVCGACVIYGAIKPSYKTLTRGALVGGMHWANVSLFFFLGDFRGTGGITAGTFAIYALYIYLNIKHNELDGR
jgi:hypothetical protein